METTTPFDLNQAIQNWRENLGQSPAFQHENLDELESHLRDSIAVLQARELSNEEAFWVGVKRTGKDAPLQKEYAKINQPAIWLDRTIWMLIGVQVWGVVSSIAGWMAQNTVFFSIANWKNLQAKNPMFPVVFLTMTHVIFLTGILVLCWWLVNRATDFFARFVQTFIRSRNGLRLTITACVLSLTFIWPRFVMDIFYSMTMKTAEFIQLQVLYQEYSTFMMIAIQPLALVATTLFLVRKRFRLKLG